ncbi:MAG: hypothetical protein HZB40_00225 [Rhodocyclales bacterium]|nr:hypothetical protein [Rhodocyclales bacterium]
MSARRAALAVLLCAALLPGVAFAQISNLLIQTLAGGGFRIWHADGVSILDDDEVMLLESLAEVGGSQPTATALGPARALRTAQGVIIELTERARDRELLVDRDACGHVKTWHAEGVTRLSEDQATDLVMAALPGGGPRLVLDAEHHAKSYLTNIGVMVAIWKPRSAGR